MNPSPVETHPWIRFPQENGNIKHLIVGSFPPNKFTIYNEKLFSGDVCFFYGSDQNVFWELFCEAKGLTFYWRCDKDRLKTWLTENHWGVTDIVLKAKRAKDSAADSDLRVEEYNKTVIEDILENNPVENIYFTSKWVKESFQSQILKKSKPNFEMIQLISPSRSGLRSLNWAFKHFPSLPDESRLDYRSRYYKFFLK